MDQVGEVDPTFLSEVWGLFGFGCTILFMRFAVRLRTVGIRGLQGDDFFAVLVLAFYTMDAATVTIIYHTKTNVESGQLQKIRPLTNDEIAQFEFGSKEELAAWYSYATLIWCLKGTMLFFFKRMTFGLWQNRLVKWLAIACALSYTAVMLTISLSCLPIQKNWQVVPDPGEVCTFKRQNFIVTTIMNVLTDAALFSIPLPLLWKLQIPVRQKVVIALFLSSGLFVITAAILRVTQTLGNNPSALNINRWGVRETIVGIFTVNVPILRPLFSRSFWKIRRGSTTNPSKGHTLSTTSSGGPGGGRAKDPYDLGPAVEMGHAYRKLSATAHIMSNDSNDELAVETVENVAPPMDAAGGAASANTGSESMGSANTGSENMGSADPGSTNMGSANTGSGQVRVDTMVRITSEATDVDDARRDATWTGGTETKASAGRLNGAEW